MGAFVEPGKWRQLAATIIINLTTFMNGVAMGWVSPMVPCLMSKETPVGNTPMTDDQISWITGAVPMGAIILLPFCGMLCERLGRKIFGLLIAVPFFICWLLKITGTNYIYLLVARFFAGFSAAMFGGLVPIYVSEIAATSIRGQLGSFLIFALNIGIVSGYILGTVLSYTTLAVCILMLPVIFFGMFLFMPETPIYLVRKGRIAEAMRSLLWLKNNDQQTARKELVLLQIYVKENVDTQKTVGFRDLFRDRGTIKGFIIALVLLGSQETTGYSVMMTYTTMIFTLANSQLSPNAATIVVGLIQIFGAWISIVMTDRAGRRSLIMVSCAGMAICHATLSVFFFVQKLGYDVSSATWLPVTALSIYAITWSFGIGPISFIVASEVFQADISSIANSIALEFMWIISFMTMKFFPVTASVIGLHGCFIVFAFFCAFTFIFTYFFVPETKGRPIDAIVNELNGCTGKHTDSEHLEATGIIESA